MKNLPNIERSTFHYGEYVGYGAGLVWRVRKVGKAWEAWPNVITHPDKRDHAHVHARTLECLSKKFSAMVSHA